MFPVSDLKAAVGNLFLVGGVKAAVVNLFLVGDVKAAVANSYLVGDLKAAVDNLFLVSDVKAAVSTRTLAVGCRYLRRNGILKTPSVPVLISTLRPGSPLYSLEGHQQP